jgi:hypothetical protein
MESKAYLGRNKCFKAFILNDSFFQTKSGYINHCLVWVFVSYRLGKLFGEFLPSCFLIKFKYQRC